MHIERLPHQPFIHAGMLPPTVGNNINGPCLVRVPEWVPNPLGRYYCYFAHHRSDHIRLAYADDLHGPWHIHDGGVFRLHELPAGKDHVASPDVLFDDATQTCRLYLHAPAVAEPGQKSFVATGTDGLTFPTVYPDILAPFYLRVWRHQSWWYGMAKGGRCFRSPDGLSPFERGPNPLIPDDHRDDMANEAGIRHVAVDVDGDRVTAYWSAIGDTPERIKRATFTMSAPWMEWRSGPHEEVLRPEFPWEGADLPMITSRVGAVYHPEHALRDPHIFTEQGQRFLVYSVQGEAALALARIHE